MAFRSATSKPGLLTVSQKRAFVLSVMAAAKFSGLLGSTNFTVMPILGKMSLNWV